MMCYYLNVHFQGQRVKMHGAKNIKLILILHSHLCLGLQSGLFPSFLPTKTMCAFLTNSVEQSHSWEANRSSASQQIPPRFMKPESPLPHSKRSPPVPILSQINPGYASSSHFLKIHYNIIFPCMPRSSKWSLSLRSPHQNPVSTSPLHHACHTPAHLIILDRSFEWYLVTNTEHKASQYPVLSTSLLILYLCGPNIFLSTLFPKTPDLCSSLKVSKQVSYSYKTTGKLIAPWS